MELKHLKDLTAQVVQEDQYELPHPTLNRAEIMRLEGKFDQIQVHTEALHRILEELDDEDLTADETAVKLHHIGHKGDLDLALFKDARKKFDAFEEAAMDMHQQWMTSIQQHTDPAFQHDEPEQPPAE